MFLSRKDAGIALGQKLLAEGIREGVILGLARGGVAVADSVKRILCLPADVLVVKKIPSPVEPEFGIGAVAPDHIVFIDRDVVERLAVPETYLTEKQQELSGLIQEKTARYRGGKAPIAVAGLTVLLVDDGAATGVSLLAAAAWASAHGAREIIAAVPVAHPEVALRLAPCVSRFIALEQPEDLAAVGQYYREFPQLTDTDVVYLLQQ